MELTSTVRMIAGIMVGLYLLLMSFIDIRKKCIPVWPGFLVMGTSITVLLVGGAGIVEIVMGIIVGGLLFGVSFASRGEIGEADALVYAVTGTVAGFYKNIEMLLLSLLMAAFVGVLLLIIKRVGRKYRLPFVPFTTVAYGMVMLT